LAHAAEQAITTSGTGDTARDGHESETTWLPVSIRAVPMRSGDVVYVRMK